MPSPTAPIGLLLLPPSPHASVDANFIHGAIFPEARHFHEQSRRRLAGWVCCGWGRVEIRCWGSWSWKSQLRRRRKGKTGGARGGTKTEPQERRSQRATEHARSTMGKDLDLAWGWATWRRPGGGGRARAREASAASLEGESKAVEGWVVVGTGLATLATGTNPLAGSVCPSSRPTRPTHSPREPLRLHSADRNRIAPRPQYTERERERETESPRARWSSPPVPAFACHPHRDQSSRSSV